MSALPVFHITHVDNLPGIVAHGLRSDNLAECYTCIGDRGIKQSRKEKTCYALGNGRQTMVADYVPFYYAPRSPMLYKINCGGVEGYDEGQHSVVHLVCNALELWNNFFCCGTNHNAACNLADFYADLASLREAVDWELMRAVYWQNIPDDPHRKSRRMAEFLVLDSLPFNFVRFIAAGSEETAAKAKAALPSSNGSCSVTVRPDWYF